MLRVDRTAVEWGAAAEAAAAGVESCQTGFFFM